MLFQDRCPALGGRGVLATGATPYHKLGEAVSIARHSVYNLAGATVPLLVALATVPLYLSVIGLDRYGVLSIAWLFLGYFNLFDLGLGRAITHRLAVLGTASEADRSRAFWTAVLLSAGFAAIATILFVPIAYAGLDLVKFGAAGLRSEALQALPWLAACLPLGIINSVAAGALEGRQRFLHLNAIATAGTVLTAVGPLAVALLYTPALPALIAAALGARALTNLLLLAECLRSVPARLPLTIHRKEAAALLDFGKWSALSSGISPILFLWDRYAIGVLISSAAVSLYVVPFTLVFQLTQIPSALMRAAFPRLASTDSAEVLRIANQGWGVLSLIVTPVILLALAFVEPFLHLWVGAGMAASSAPVAYVLLLGIWPNAFAWLPYFVITARNQPRTPALLHLAELVPYVLLLYFALTEFGILGAAIAWSTRMTIDALILFRLARFPGKLLVDILPQALILLAAAAVSFEFSMDSAVRWLAHAALFGASLYLLMVRSPDAWVEMRRRIGSLARSEAVEAQD